MRQHEPFISERRSCRRECRVDRASQWWPSWELGSVRDRESAFGLEVGERVMLKIRAWEAWARTCAARIEDAERDAEGRLFV